MDETQRRANGNEGNSGIIEEIVEEDGQLGIEN